MADKKALRENTLDQWFGGLKVTVSKNTETGKKYGQMSRRLKNREGQQEWHNLRFFANDNFEAMKEGLTQMESKLKEQ